MAAVPAGVPAHGAAAAVKTPVNFVDVAHRGAGVVDSEGDTSRESMPWPRLPKLSTPRLPSSVATVPEASQRTARMPREVSPVNFSA